MEETPKKPTNVGVLYKGRIPRFFLLLGSLLGLVLIIAGYFGKGPLHVDVFESYGKFFVALITYILLTLVSLRANFRCQQITCPSVFSVIFLLAYYSYPPFLKVFGFILLAIALYIIVKTLFLFSKKEKAYKNQ